ncbi:hypothetical protein LTR78_006907 [Recurvomyces mirabilis]|uniref:Transcription elongation factor Eaf N-terminal domain-containing protein n=2 Tax=Recurvomyces mirabilis TaxID=574656 RepID=A0AAE0WKF4_9PEZI|nr:hypothetical protein LTR78_006907 [Recurvomyces mirabilis]
MPAVDFKAPGTYSIRLGSSFGGKAGAPKKYQSVRYNHRPTLRREEQSTSRISRNSANTASGLLLQDGEDEYRYTGQGQEAEDSYVLVIKDGEDAVLEKLSADWVFNLTTTPIQSDADVLQEQHTHVSLNDEVEEGLFGDHDEGKEAPLDPDNPFDYRHYLKTASEAKSRPAETEGPRSTLGTPQHPRPASATPISRPVRRTADSALVPQKKRKIQTTAATTTTAKRTKVADSPATASAKTKTTKTQTSRSNEPPPKIRVDRKASLRQPDDEDDNGELVLENGDSSSKGTSRNAMSLALSGQLGEAPISLQSAANTPNSHIAGSPAPIRPDEIEEAAEEEEEGERTFTFEMGSSPEHFGANPSRNPRGHNDEDDDADVEDLELPSPAAVHKPSISAATVTNATAGGDEDDLDAQLAAAMAEEEGPGVVEDEEESEEE